MKPEQPHPSSFPSDTSPNPSAPFGGPSDHDPHEHEASDTRARLGEKARGAKEKLKEKTRATADDLKARGEDYAEERKDRTADRIDRYGDKVEAAADSLEEEDPNIAWATHRVAKRLSGLADHLRDRDFRGLWQDAEGLAGRHPIAFAGGMFAAGVVVGSAVRAARADAGDDEREEDYSRGAYAGETERFPVEDDPVANPGTPHTTF
jgi:hypothetical protein